jgi:cytochrome b subunit of formate dehydrogenase
MTEDEEEDLDEEVVRYGPKVIIMHWAVVIVFIPLAVTGLMLLRDWFRESFAIHGGDLLIPTIEGATTVHVLSGLTIAVLGAIHIILHLRQKEKPMLPKNVFDEIKASLQTVFYVTYISRNIEVGSAGKYKANQRMSYIATFYILSLSALTSIFIYSSSVGEAGSAMHVVAGVLMALLVTYRSLYLIRNWDWIAIRCIFWTGRMPMWYIKEQHYRWYVQLKEGAPSSEGSQASKAATAPE